jgi:hypothetical protein
MFAAIAAYRPPAPPGAPRPSAHGAEGAPPRRGVVRVGPPGPGGRLAGRFSAGVGRTKDGRTVGKHVKRAFQTYKVRIQVT